MDCADRTRDGRQPCTTRYTAPLFSLPNLGGTGSPVLPGFGRWRQYDCRRTRLHITASSTQAVAVVTSSAIPDVNAGQMKFVATAAGRTCSRNEYLICPQRLPDINSYHSFWTSLTVSNKVSKCVLYRDVIRRGCDYHHHHHCRSTSCVVSIST